MEPYRSIHWESKTESVPLFIKYGGTTMEPMWNHSHKYPIKT